MEPEGQLPTESRGEWLTLLLRVREVPGSNSGLMMEALRTSQTSVNFNVTTQRYIPEDSQLYNLILFVVILSSSMQMAEKYLKLFQDCSFIIHVSFLNSTLFSMNC
jgi:hypothetical protein